MKVVKNKVAAPFKVVFFDILFGSGIDSLGCMLDAANELDIVVRKGSWYSYKDSNFAQGKVKAVECLKSNTEMCAEIEEQVRDALLNLKSPEDLPAVVAVEDEAAVSTKVEVEGEAAGKV